MKKKHTAQSAFLNLCISLGVLVFLAGILIALFAATGSQPFTSERTPHLPAGGVYEAWVARYNGTGNSYDEAHRLLPLITPGTFMSLERVAAPEHSTITPP